MLCRSFKLPSGGGGFVCFEHRGKEPQKPCYICGKPATRLCDYHDGHATCNRPMCIDHTHTYGTDIDFCDVHDNEFSRAKTNKELKKLKQEK